MDKYKFKYYAAKKGVSMQTLSDEMGINPATLSKKIGGTSEFTHREISVYRNVVGITDQELVEIFFAQDFA